MTLLDLLWLDFEFWSLVSWVDFSFDSTSEKHVMCFEIDRALGRDFSSSLNWSSLNWNRLHPNNFLIGWERSHKGNSFIVLCMKSTSSIRNFSKLFKTFVFVSFCSFVLVLCFENCVLLVWDFEVFIRKNSCNVLRIINILASLIRGDGVTWQGHLIKRSE